MQITQFQSACTALAATIRTGNIERLGDIFLSIIRGAFGIRAVGGGIVGSSIAYAVLFFCTWLESIWQ
ncbi:hypothetical protein [Butyrivibrio proteoclasticus]|uniref:hypothetical protein n=1 Tax=Butyrivibrio proteoclasticus TaxID=43305 RepID=UPI00047BA001|nr:hypothetical protein [Butyrivibrio proteoclasticus]